MEESDIGGDKSLFLSTEVLKDVIVDIGGTIPKVKSKVDL